MANTDLGSPDWWRRFLIKELLAGQQRFDLLDDYASGNHPVPNADQRYFKALREIQTKARTNYYGMITKAPIERMRVQGFRFGPDGEADETAKMVWAFNDMDYQAQYVLSNCARFGRGYVLVSPPEEGEEVEIPDTEAEKKAKEQGNPSTRSGSDRPSGDGGKPRPAPGDKPSPKPDPKNDLNKKFPVSKAGEDFEFPEAEAPEEPKMVKKALPVLTWEDPRMCITFQDPIRPTRSLAGLKLWSDVTKGQVFCILWLRDKTYWYEGPKITDIEGMPIDKLENTLSSAEGTFKLVRTEKSEIGEVPLVYIEWQPEALAECEDLLDVQDRINLTLLHRLVITQNQSFRQRWMSGVTPRKGKRAADRPQFDPGADMLWVTDNPDAKFGDFAQADIRQVLEAIRDDINDMAALSKTPVHYLMGKIANVSGDTLTQGESGFVSKIRMRMASVGWGLEKAMKIVFLYLKDEEKAKQVDAEVIWADPEVRTRAETSDAAVKEAQVLADAPPYALAVVMKRMGFAPDEIKYVMAEAEKHQAEQRAREDQQLAQQHENMKEAGLQQQEGQSELTDKTLGAQKEMTKMQVAANKPRPGSGGPAAKKSSPSGRGK